MKNELLKIWRCEPYKNQHFTVDLVNDSLYEWNVRLLLPAIDADSPLHDDLKKLKQSTGREGILLHFIFKERYPLEAPFVRVAEPVISSEFHQTSHAIELRNCSFAFIHPEGHVFEIGGVMCMELLMEQGWIPAFTVEGVIMQIAATLVRGDGRVDFNASADEYSLERAQMGLKQLEQMPDRSRKIVLLAMVQV